MTKRHNLTEAEYRQYVRDRYEKFYKHVGPPISQLEGPDRNDFQPYQLRTGGWLGDGCRWVSGGFLAGHGESHWYWGRSD